MENVEIINAVTKLHNEMKSAFDNEMKANGVVTSEVKEKLAKMEADQLALVNRVTAAEQKAVALKIADKPEVKSIGTQFAESADVRQVAESKSRNAMIEIKSTFTTPSMVAPVMAQPQGANVFAFNLRNYLPTIPVSSDLVKVPQETTYTNNAAIKAYGAAGNESTLALTMVDVPVRTVSHFTNIGKEVLADSPQFAAYVDQRLKWGLQGAEEGQLLIGDGTGTNIKGLVTYATSKTFTTETMLDRIALAIADVLATGHVPSFVVVAPADWGKLVTAKADTAGTYMLGNPAFGFTPSVWGVPVVVSPKMTATNFLVGSAQAAAVAERQTTVLSLSYDHASNFTSGIVTVMAEQREALEVFVPGAFITGLLA